MTDVYKFKIKLQELEHIIWRDIEITSVSSIAKLGYSILAAFEGAASHLFCIRHEGKRYEILLVEADFDLEPVIDAIKTKLSALKLSVGDVMTMEYDYGAGWEFSIELISITEMKRGTGSHYPYVTDGNGKGIIEDTSPYELIEIIKRTDETGLSAKVFDHISEREMDWDYKSFNLEHCNLFLKGHVVRMRDAYEIY